MKNLKIAAAVSAAMMSSGAFALSPTEAIAPTTIQLVVAGASAARDTFATEFQAICASNINLYQASPTSNQDFRAYTCRLGPLAGALNGRDATVYYRSEGGSVWGPGSIAKSQAITRLDFANGTPACTQVAPPAFGLCAASGYSLTTDTGSGHLSKVTPTDLGVSDVEPGMFRGENWVGLGLGVEPAPGALESLNYVQRFSQTFGVLVASGLPISSISAQDVASIYAGTYSNWSQVQDQVTGNALPAQAIRVCRRENGSGTQAAAAIHFLKQNCGTSSEPFVTQPFGPNGNVVVENGTTSTLESCIAVAGSIGPNIFKTSAPAGTKYLAIDGVAPLKANAARGTYDNWFELAFTKRAGLAGDPGTLADTLIARGQDVTGIPGTSASAFAIPFLTGNNNPVLPVNGAPLSTPIGIGTKNGNSCKTALGQL